MTNKGFTLMEVLIAMIILAGSLMVLSNSSSSSVSTVVKANKVEQIARLLEQKMVELELANRGKKFEELEKQDSGDFGTDYPDLAWQMEITEFPAPNLAAMALQEEGQDEMVLTLLNKFSEHMQKSVMEMKVSVIWKTEKRNLNYSVTTLLVDYDVPIQF